MLSKETHGVKPCLSTKVARQEPQERLLLPEGQTCFSKFSGRNTIHFLGVITIFALAGLLFLTGCSSDPGGGGGDTVDTSALGNKIAEAKAERDAASVSPFGDGTDIPIGTYWVSAAVKAAFTAAIDNAELVYAAAQSQSAVNNAVTRLDNAIDTFKKAKLPGRATPVDKTPLNAKIIEAESLKSNTVVAVNSGEVAQGAYWVTQEEMDDFTEAITMVKEFRDTATDQATVYGMETYLDYAIGTFTGARGTGTKTSGFTAAEMTALIERANTAKAGVETGTDGNDISPVKFWVASSDLSALNNAITTAQNASGDSAYLALVAAINTFTDAKELGRTPDRDSLFTAILSAVDAQIGVVTAESASQVPLDSKWATTTQWQPLNTAFNSALAVASNYDATYNNVEAAKTALNSATSVFSAAVSANGPGTRQNTITINGFDTTTYPNGSEIGVGLFLTNEVSEDTEPDIYGYGIIQNGTVTINLNTSFGAWAETGSWFVFSKVRTGVYQRFLISKNAVNFTAAIPNPNINLSDFNKIGFPTILGMISWELFESSPSMTLNQWVNAVYNGDPSNYAAFREAAGITFYKDRSLTQQYNGGDTINADTTIYTEIRFDEYDLRQQIGEITGSITLTGISNPPPKVYIRANGQDDNSNRWWSLESEIKGITGSSGTFNWSIPVYDRDNFVAGEIIFTLRVLPFGNDNGFSIEIPGRKNVSSYDDDVGDLGSVSIATITLSGTANFTNQGNRVPRVQIYVQNQYHDLFGSTTLNSPAPNAPWSITIPAHNTPEEIHFTIVGLQNNGEWLFSKEIHPDRPVTVSNIDVSGISLSFAFKTITLSGTITATYGGSPVPIVRIAVICTKSNYDEYIHLNSPDSNTSWSITMPARDPPEDIYFVISGYSNDGNPLFNRDINPNATKTVSNQSIGGISLNVAVQTITLSGTINATYGGNPFPSVVITAKSQNSDHLGFTSLSSPNANAPWSITMAALDSPEEIYFNILGYPNDGAYLFNRDINPDATKTVLDQSIGGIQINLGETDLYHPSNTTPLSANSWSDGEITSQNERKVYAMTVSANQTYYIWTNTLHYGNYMKTLSHCYLTILDSNRNPIQYDNSAFLYNPWENPASFTASSNGTVYLSVSSSDTGTYGIVYSTSDTRPQAPFNPPSTTLTSGVWEDGDSTESTETDWYSFNADSGQTYYIWWDDEDYSDGKTAWVMVIVFDSDGNRLGFKTDPNGNTQYVSVSNVSGTVYIKVNIVTATGTYGIAYTTDNSRPSQ